MLKISKKTNPSKLITTSGMAMEIKNKVRIITGTSDTSDTLFTRKIKGSDEIAK